jgi:predicted MFS family arabinose efflux permease
MSLWRRRDFALFWTGESVSEVGNSVTIVVMPLVAIDVLHTSTFVVTVLTAMIWLPWLIIGVPAGAWIDRLPPRPVMLICDAVSLTALASVPVARWLGALTVAQLIAVALILGTSTVFFRTAYNVLLPGITGQADIAEGNAKLMGSREVAQVGGPSIGGFVAQALGPVIGMLADAISFAVSFACLTCLDRPRERTSGTPASGGMLDGLRFAFRDPYLRAITVFSSTANLALTGTEALIVVFLVRTIGLSAGAAGLVVAASGVGGVTGALVARRLGRRFGTARAMLIADAGGLTFALLLPLAYRGPALAFAVVANLVCAGGIVAGNVFAVSFMQTYVPPDMLGRVSSASYSAGFAMMPAGALMGGGLATALGVRGALWVLSGLIAAAGLMYLTTPLRRLRDLPKRAEPAPGQAAPGQAAPGQAVAAP